MSRRAKLTAYLAEVARTPFSEGQHDCALFAAGAIQAMTGRDLAAEWRGRYRTTKGGIRVLRKAGYNSHIAYAASLFEQTVTPRIGDLAVVEAEDGPALGVVQGTHAYVVGRQGLTLLPISAARKFFEVE